MSKDSELDRLLAKGRLSRPEKERILQEVLSSAAPARSVKRRPWMFAGAFGFAVALVAAVVVWPKAPAPSEFRSKSAGALGPSVRAGCPSGCSRGAKLLFETERLDAPLHLAAFSIAPDGARIWYFPAAGQLAPKVEPGRARAVFPKAARIGPEHKPGVYTVHLMLLSKPLTQRGLQSVLQQKEQAEIVVRRTQMIEVAP